MLQPRKNTGLRPAHVVGGGAAIVVVLLGVTIVIHTIVGILSFLVEILVVGFVVGMLFRFLRRSRRG
jgi:hypothetical protein